MPQIDPNNPNIVIEDRPIIVYDAVSRKHAPAGYTVDPATGLLVSSGKDVQLPASMIPLSTEAGNGIRLSDTDGKLYVSPTAVINVNDDQALVASTTDTTQVTVTSTTKETTVDGVHEVTTDHSFKVDVKVAGAVDDVPNALIARADGLYVAREVLGDAVPPKTAADGGISFDIFGGLDATLGNPIAWLEVAVHSADGVWLHTVPSFKKRFVPTGTSITATPSGGGETDDYNPPPPPPPPPENSEQPPPPPPLTWADVELAVRSTPANYPAGLVASVATIQSSVAAGAAAPANNFEIAQAIAQNWTGFSAADLASYFAALKAMGITEANAVADIYAGVAQPDYAAGQFIVHTGFNYKDQYAVFDPNQAATTLNLPAGTVVTVTDIIKAQAFTWTTDRAAATHMSSGSANTFLAPFSFFAFRWSNGFQGTWLNVLPD